MWHISSAKKTHPETCKTTSGANNSIDIAIYILSELGDSDRKYKTKQLLTLLCSTYMIKC